VNDILVKDESASTIAGQPFIMHDWYADEVVKGGRKNKAFVVVLHGAKRSKGKVVGLVQIAEPSVLFGPGEHSTFIERLADEGYTVLDADTCVIAWFTHEAMRRKGMMHRAVPLAFKKARAAGKRCLLAVMAPDNIASAALAHSQGFTCIVENLKCPADFIVGGVANVWKLTLDEHALAAAPVAVAVPVPIAVPVRGRGRVHAAATAAVPAAAPPAAAAGVTGAVHGLGLGTPLHAPLALNDGADDGIDAASSDAAGVAGAEEGSMAGATEAEAAAPAPAAVAQVTAEESKSESRMAGQKRQRDETFDANAAPHNAAAAVHGTSAAALPVSAPIEHNVRGDTTMHATVATAIVGKHAEQGEHLAAAEPAVKLQPQREAAAVAEQVVGKTDRQAVMPSVQPDAPAAAAATAYAPADPAWARGVQCGEHVGAALPPKPTLTEAHPQLLATGVTPLATRPATRSSPEGLNAASDPTGPSNPLLQAHAPALASVMAAVTAQSHFSTFSASPWSSADARTAPEQASITGVLAADMAPMALALAPPLPAPLVANVNPHAPHDAAPAALASGAAPAGGDGAGIPLAVVMLLGVRGMAQRATGNGMTKADADSCERALHAIHMKDFKLFEVPVAELVQLPGYVGVIGHPIDRGMICDNLKQRPPRYASLQAFCNDVRRMVNNCKMFWSGAVNQDAAAREYVQRADTCWAAFVERFNGEFLGKAMVE
jgi:hypothetical protein